MEIRKPITQKDTVSCRLIDKSFVDFVIIANAKINNVAINTLKNTIIKESRDAPIYLVKTPINAKHTCDSNR